ncbi:MAG: two-component system sensor histidine kinase NtrB [Dissulfurispiraceae bacterium]|jgi:two-component system, NtrC family, nitrogen regulation sensor histidine kinase GlnL
MISLEGLINNLDEVVCLFDCNGRLVFINKVGEEFFGRNLRELKNRPLGDLFPGSDDIEMLFQKTLVEGRLYNCKEMEIDIGRVVNVDLHLAPFYSTDSLEGAICCIRENLSLTEREDYQFDHLLYLLGSLAHEIKNPLSGIKGAAQILKTAPDNAEAGECVNLILKEADRLNAVLQGYLTMTRLPRFHQLNIHEVVEHALRVMDPAVREGGIAVEKSYDPSLPYISGDEGKLLQVFINLIKNALEAIELVRGDRILSISTRPSNEYVLIYDNSGPVKSKKRTKKRRWVVVNFQDSGIGLNRDEMSRIFLPLYTKKEKGSGLGLALSKKIIKDHGGIIRVKSSMGEGSTFSVYLPLPATNAWKE